MDPFWIVVLIVHVLAVVDVWLTRLPSAAKVLWSLTVLCLPVVGFASWLVTRGSAYRELEEIPPLPAE